MGPRWGVAFFWNVASRAFGLGRLPWFVPSQTWAVS